MLGGVDFLYSQANGVEETLFKGHVLGVNADIAGSSFRERRAQSLSHLRDGLECPERFFRRVALHVARNLLCGPEGTLNHLKVPLILGVWGHKGCGKTFNVELALKRINCHPIVISAGELEDPVAGQPGQLLRERYLEAARAIQRTGELTCLVIQDLDAGVGNFRNTDRTVNTQNVQGSLMALCDAPSQVSVGFQWEVTPEALPRVPIIITANDLSTVYAPLVRDGRMCKFYWEPTREELVHMLAGLFDGDVSSSDCGHLVDTFPHQPLDFFQALASNLWDDAVRAWIRAAPLERLESRLGYADGDRGTGGMEGSVPVPDMSRAALVACGRALQDQQQHVLDNNLAREYVPFPAGSPPLAFAWLACSLVCSRWQLVSQPRRPGRHGRNGN